jgi:hypothetical protein
LTGSLLTLCVATWVCVAVVSGGGSLNSLSPWQSQILSVRWRGFRINLAGVSSNESRWQLRFHVNLPFSFSTSRLPAWM